MAKAILIDGNSLMFRSYYATAYTGNLMKNSSGLFTNAVFGFCNMITKVLDSEYDYIFVAFDKGKHTFRHLAYDDYKGGRKPMPDEFRVQIPYIKKYLDVLNIKHEELDGFIKSSTISNVLRDFSAYPMEKSGSFGVIKIFESMEAALPIICSDMPIYRDIMKEYKCGILVDPLNEQQIHEAIQYLVTHKEEAWRMGQEGRRAVIEKYSWDALSVVFLRIVNGLIGKEINNDKS